MIWSNIFRNVRNRSQFLVMCEKVFRRLVEIPKRRNAKQALEWCSSHKQSVQHLIFAAAPELASQTRAYEMSVMSRAQDVLPRLGVDLGGGAHYPLLYFLVRQFKPQTVVETGVAAGFSAHAILTALSENGCGHLYSSDFPYFRLEEPEKYIGILVDDSLKDRWKLYIEGDRKNLPRILQQCGSVDLFHYDSDKSYAGRRFAMDLVMPRLSRKAIVIMDDIQDNLFFKDFVERTGRHHSVFEFEGKYVGMLRDE